MISSLSVEGSPLKVSSFSFGSPVSAYAVSKPIFYIKATKYKKIFLHLCCLDQSKLSYPLVLWLQAPRQKAVVVSLLLFPAQADQEVLSLDHQQGGSEFETFPKIMIDHVSYAVTDNTPLWYKSKTVEKTVIEDVEDDIYELPGSYFSKASARLFDKIYNEKADVLPLSKFLTWLKHLGRVFIVRSCRIICRN